MGNKEMAKEKRKRDDDSDDAGERKAKTSSGGARILPSTIKNKIKRTEVHAKLKREKKVEKRRKAQARDAATKKALELGEEVNYSVISFVFS